MTTYRALFPIDVNDENKYIRYDIAVLPYHVGAVNNQWWHAPINDIPTPEEAIKMARKVLEYLVKKKTCPCEQTLCRAPWFPDYDVKGSPKPKRKKTEE